MFQAKPPAAATSGDDDQGGDQRQPALAGDQPGDVRRGDERLPHRAPARVDDVVGDQPAIGAPERRDLVVGVADAVELHPAGAERRRNATRCSRRIAEDQRQQRDGEDEAGGIEEDRPGLAGKARQAGRRGGRG